MSVSYSTGTAATIDDMHLKLRAAMVAAGWTLIDVISDVTGTRDVVYQSATLEPGADNYCYLRLNVTANTWSHRVYTDWDTGTNTGSKEAGVNGQSSISLTGSQYWMRVNEFAVALVYKSSASYYKMYGGFLRRGLPRAKSGITKTTAGYAAGAFTMNVNTDMTSRLKVGQRVVIYNHSHNSAGANFNNSEVLTIQSVAAGSITFVTATTKAYDSGAVIGWNPHPAITLYFSSGSLESANTYATMFHDGVWSSNTGQDIDGFAVILATESYTDPDEISMEFMPGVYAFHFITAGKTGFHGYSYHWEAAAWNTQAIEDVMTDGANNFLVFYTASGSCTLLGPIS